MQKPHGDGDILSTPSGEARQMSAGIFFLYIIFSFSSSAFHGSFSGYDLLSPRLPIYKMSIMHLRERSVTSFISSRPLSTSHPSGTDLQSLHAPTTLPLEANVYELRN